MFKWFKRKKTEQKDALNQLSDIIVTYLNLSCRMDKLDSIIQGHKDRQLKIVDYDRLLEEYDQIWESVDTAKDIIRDAKRHANQSNDLDYLLITSFDWEEPGNDLDMHQTHKIQKAVYNSKNDDYQASFKKVARLLQERDLTRESKTVNSLLSQTRVYKELRDNFDLSGSQEERLENLDKAHKLCKKAAKEFNETLYWVDAFYKNIPEENEKARNYFIQLGANKEGSWEKIWGFAFERLELARQASDAVIQAYKDSVRNYIDSNENWAYNNDIGVVEKLSAMNDYENIGKKIDRNCAKARIAGLRNKIEEATAEVKEEFPMQPYQDIVLSKIKPSKLKII